MPNLVPHNCRGLLAGIGVQDFTATMLIRFMMMAPHATDPDMPAIIQMTRAIQKALNRMGAGLEITGAIDQPTDDYLRRLCGDGYLTRPWYQIVEGVVSAQNRGTQFYQEPRAATPQAIGGTFDFLPDVPGGPITLGLGAVALWYLFKKR